MTPTHRHTTLADLRSLVDSPLRADHAGAARFLSLEVESGLFLLSRELAVDAPLTFESESFPASTLSVRVLEGEATSHTRGVEGFGPNEVVDRLRQ